VALGLLVLALPISVGGFRYWRDTRFPARSERLAGTPIELRVQDGVSTSELVTIRRGLRITDRFMSSALGRTVRRHVEARVAHSNGCRPFQKAGEALVGEAQRGFLCIDTSSPAWQWLMLKNRLSATAAAGHEYVHVLQGELGCLEAPAGQHYRWLLEGMAEQVSWQALVAAGRARPSRVAREIRENGAFDSNLEPLRSYERAGGRDPEYALWHFAVDRLLGDAAATVARRQPERALRRFCVRVARGQRWHDAFRRSFGLAVEKFYAGFERARRNERLRLSAGGP
jgi:hypothetical protein